MSEFFLMQPRNGHRETANCATKNHVFIHSSCFFGESEVDKFIRSVPASTTGCIIKKNCFMPTAYVSTILTRWFAGCCFSNLLHMASSLSKFACAADVSGGLDVSL
jgi:hypothetical protein